MTKQFKNFFLTINIQTIDIKASAWDDNQDWVLTSLSTFFTHSAGAYMRLGFKLYKCSR